MDSCPWGHSLGQLVTGGRALEGEGKIVTEIVSAS